MSNPVKCPTCGTLVEPVLKGTSPLSVKIGDEGRYEIGVCLLLQCTYCLHPIVEIKSSEITQVESGDTLVVWPSPPVSSFVDESVIPSEIRAVLLEAEKCYQNKLYNAYAMMAGRVAELICIEQGASLQAALSQKLRQLEQNGKVSKSVVQKLKAVVELRNKAVHGALEEILPEVASQARNLLLSLIADIYDVVKPKVPQWKNRKRYASERLDSTPLAERVTVECIGGPLDKLRIVKSILDDLSFPGKYGYRIDVEGSGELHPYLVWSESDVYDAALAPQLLKQVKDGYESIIRSINSGQSVNWDADVKRLELQLKALTKRLSIGAEKKELLR